jgi:hypothetical protein
VARRQPSRKPGGQPGVPFEIVAVVERLIQRRQDVGRKHGVDLLLRRTNPGCVLSARPWLLLRSLLGVVKQPLDLRREGGQR